MKKFSRRRMLRAMLGACAAPFVSAPGVARAEGGVEGERPFHHLPDGTFRNNHIGQINKPFAELLKWRRESPGHPLLSFPPAPFASDLVRDPARRSLTWVGHATFLLQTGGEKGGRGGRGMSVLTDPHFSMRASPFSFAGPRRGTPPAPAMEELPRVDAILISHNHYDHLDSESVRMLAERNPAARFFCPLGLGDFLRARGAADVLEMDWGESAEWGGAIFHAEPCQHWSSRFPWDRNRTLWASWVLESPDFRFVFIGDTGYSPDFAALGGRHGGFDWAAIPIGAYSPRWFMRQAHISPEESVQIFADLKTRNAVGSHWGTFQLTDEPMDEPPQKLRKAARNAGVDSFHIFQHGETREI